MQKIKLKTIGYLNLKTGEFFKKRIDWIKSIEKANLKDFNKKVSKQGRAFMKLCLLEIKLAKAKMIKGYSWVKSCLLATIKNEIKAVKYSLSKEQRGLLF